jgi:hypothetical protein
MSDLDPALKAKADLLADIRRKVNMVVVELDRGGGVELEVVIEQLRQKFKS